MAKSLSILADMRREEQFDSLMQMPDRDLCEMIRTHFESHPTMPNEKALKDRATYELSQIDGNEQENPFDNGISLDAAVKEELARGYSQTRIRETSLREGTHYLDFRHFDLAALKRERVAQIPQEGQADILVERVSVELQKTAHDVYVLAPQSDGSWRSVGTLPDSFLVNNPMNVDSCEAELQIADFSNGKMKNLSAKVVADTDLMSGDIIDLDEDLLSGLEQESGMER